MRNRTLLRPVSWNGLWSLLLGGALLLAGPPDAVAAEGVTTVKDSVVAALGYSPRLKMLQSNREAIDHERERARGGYYPRIDLTLGHGSEMHNDESTRLRGRENHFVDRSEATLQLTQLLYDGDETGSRVGIEVAKLESADFRVFDNAESIALDAVIAHLEVYRQRELLALAEKNVRDHQEIVAMLEERQRGGAGSIADVVQAQGRLARSRSSLAEVKGDLLRAEANYQRVVGGLPGQVEYAPVPQAYVPQSMEQALETTRAHNPKVLALAANVDEAGQRIRLSESDFYPKVTLELSSSYEDQVESNDTYEHNNQGMVRLRWNLLNGGATVADRQASLSRKAQAVASRSDQLVQVFEETRGTWAQFQAAKEQVVAFGDAVNYNEKTLDAYLKQFKVAQRTLLDVLDARNELFQSSGLLVTARVNEIIAVHRLNALGGQLNRSMTVDPALYEARGED